MTLFELIAPYGRRMTERRAMKAVWYAERKRLRETDVGTIRFLDDYFTMEMWEEESDHWSSCRPLWFRAAQHLHWWMDEHGPRATRNKIKWFWQRGKRGYSDQDLWGFDYHLSRVMRDGITELNKIKHGWPGEPMTFEDWTQILQEISTGMQAHLDILDVTIDRDSAEQTRLCSQRDRAFDHMKLYWGSLWD